MTLLDVIREMVNLDKGTMEAPVVHLIDYTGHPCTIIFLPFLLVLQIFHELLMCLIEI